MSTNKYLPGFIDIYFAIILGTAVKIFLKNFEPLSFSLDGEDVGRTLVFISAVFVIVYDWVAYHKLTELIPYSDEHWYARFIVDLLLFSFMFLLVHLVVSDFHKYVLSLAILFYLVAIWHTTAYFQKTTLLSKACANQKQKIESAINGGMIFGYIIGTLFLAIYYAMEFIYVLGSIELYWKQGVLAFVLFFICAARYICISKLPNK